jgi:hypothetical protein
VLTTCANILAAQVFISTDKSIFFMLYVVKKLSSAASKRRFEPSERLRQLQNAVLSLPSGIGSSKMLFCAFRAASVAPKRRFKTSEQRR